MTETARYKYPLKLPASLKETVARLAKDDGVSLNQWIEGVVNAAREAVVTLPLRGPAGLEREIEAVIDTGHSGFLTLPASRSSRPTRAWT